MSKAALKDWQNEFGLAQRKPPHFFSSAEQLGDEKGSVPQAHALRRAFEHDRLKIDGVLCHDKTPIIYFRQVPRIVPNEVFELHRLFWNQGVAPILVLIAPDEVHVYSGLLSPAMTQNAAGDPAGFVEKLNRVSAELHAFILSVETGEYFHQYRPSFDPRQRVDRNLLRHLEAARDLLDKVPAPKLERLTLDALLCRIVFTSYLFDREIIDRNYLKDAGIDNAEHLKDILGRKPRSEAKVDLYRLFSQLGQDFNGDLFSDNLNAESKQIKAEHLDILNDFVRGTDPVSHQPSFWPYEFGIIPIETISAIYEHFLKAAGVREKKESGAFYTPRFLAELVLDSSLAAERRLLDKKFLDPACGSGIFLVGLFNRLAEQWNHENPNASYNAEVKGLTTILKTNLFGIDNNRSACLIAAFSLCLAFLDQLSPPDIRRVLKKIKVLPRLIADGGTDAATIRCADFFSDEIPLPKPLNFVVGNPPWAKSKGPTAPSSIWCATRNLPFPGKQIATAFIWKAAECLTSGGKACFVLPHGLLFNHTASAVDFQRRWFTTHAVEVIINLADFQRFLFEEAEAPALVVRYAKEEPPNSAHRIDYWSPKTDWAVTQAEVISILPQDRARISLREVLDDLKGDDAPLIWKERYWATTRDTRLLDRLRLYPRLRDVLGQRGDSSGKRWIVAEGFEPFGANDAPTTRRNVRLPQTARVEASTHELDLFLLPEDCDIQKSLKLDLRRAISDTSIFKKPLVLVTEGFSNVAFANFDIAYRHGIRGIHGPADDTGQLAFLAVYLRSNLARYFLFHTSASWGVSRARVDIDDLMRLPFPFPEQTNNPPRASQIITEVQQIIVIAMQEAAGLTLHRDVVINHAQARAEALVEEYFDIDGIEKMLITDTAEIIIPSVRPTRARPDVPSIRQSNDSRRSAYMHLLCDTLNAWAKNGYTVHGIASADSSIGVGMVVLEKTPHGKAPSHLNGTATDVLKAIDHLQHITAKNHGTFQLLQGMKIFDKNLLYITKPLGQRFWTNTAALNDADEIAGTIISRTAPEGK